MNIVYIVYTPDLSSRKAVVISEPIPHLPFRVEFYEHDKLDHTRRVSTAGMAESAADDWCNVDDRVSCGPGWPD